MTIEQLEIIKEQSECLFSEADVEDALMRMALEIERDLSKKLPVVITVMNGGLITTARLASKLRFPLEMDFVHVSRYRNDTFGSELKWYATPSVQLKNRCVLIVDDILDEGVTLREVIDYCKGQGASEVLSAVLLKKNSSRVVPNISANFVGMEVDDRYVFGSGLDFKGYLRNLPGIYAVPEEVLLNN
jgi:hypoxanthine phosphoribosyltransferase